jgi:hypothetical protein
MILGTANAGPMPENIFRRNRINLKLPTPAS